MKKYKKENTGAPKKILAETAEPCSWSSIQACNCAPDLRIKPRSPILQGTIASLEAQGSAVSKKSEIQIKTRPTGHQNKIHAKVRWCMADL